MRPEIVDNRTSKTSTHEHAKSTSSASSFESQFTTLSLSDMTQNISTPSDMRSENSETKQTKRTGYVDCLTSEQECNLLELWALIIELLSNEQRLSPDCSISSSSSTSKGSKKKQRQLAEVLSQNASTHSLNSITSTSSSRSAAISDHPLSAEFWRQLATDDPDVLLLRFLRARKWNVIDAFFMFHEALKWRRSFGVNDILRKGDYKAIKRELLEGGKGFFYGYDRDGRLVVVLAARLHDRYAQTLEENMAHTVLLMETGRRCMRPGIETVTLLFDLLDAPISSFDPGSMQFMIECFQSYYPESLGRCYVLNAPWIFWGFWRMIKPWLDPVVASKIFFIEDPEKEMPAYIAPEMLLQEFGGKAEYKFKFHPPKSLDYPKPLAEEEINKINDELIVEQTRLIDATLHLHSLLNNSHNLFDSVGPILDQRELCEKWRLERKEIIKRTRGLLRREDAASVPPHMYERLGAVRPDGTLNWGKIV
jgi:hypothetical protein